MRSNLAPFVCLLVFVFAGVAVAPVRAQSSDESAARTKIVALEHAWDLAIESNDLKALDSLFDSALVYITQEGKLLTKADFLLSLKVTPLQKVVTESMSVQVFGDTAIVSGVYRSSELQNGKPLLRRGRFLNAWVYKDRTWVCVAAQDTPILR